MKKFSITSPFSKALNGELVLENGKVTKVSKDFDSFMGQEEGHVLKRIRDNGWNLKSSGETKSVELTSVAEALNNAKTADSKQSVKEDGKMKKQTAKTETKPEIKAETTAERKARLAAELKQIENEEAQAKEEADALMENIPDAKNSLRNGANLTKFLKSFASKYNYRVRNYISKAEKEANFPTTEPVVKLERRGTGRCGICGGECETKGKHVLTSEKISKLPIHQRCAESVCIEDPTGFRMGELEFYGYHLPEATVEWILNLIGGVYRSIHAEMAVRRENAFGNAKNDMVEIFDEDIDPDKEVLEGLGDDENEECESLFKAASKKRSSKQIAKELVDEADDAPSIEDEDDDDIIASLIKDVEARESGDDEDGDEDDNDDSDDDEGEVVMINSSSKAARAGSKGHGKNQSVAEAGFHKIMSALEEVKKMNQRINAMASRLR